MGCQACQACLGARPGWQAQAGRTGLGTRPAAGHARQQVAAFLSGFETHFMLQKVSSKQGECGQQPSAGPGKGMRQGIWAAPALVQLVPVRLQPCRPGVKL